MQFNKGKKYLKHFMVLVYKIYLLKGILKGRKEINNIMFSYLDNFQWNTDSFIVLLFVGICSAS